MYSDTIIMIMCTEEWCNIKGYDRYEISNLGRVRNKKRGNFKSLVKGGERLQVGLLQQGKTVKVVSLARLMRENWRYEFIKELDDGEECMPVRNHSNYFITNKGRLFSLTHYKWLKSHQGNRTYYPIR